jgi:glycosyltransferase involved in cell wall biosynthesis
VQVSVVIPTKDRLKFLERVLPTYLMQEEVKEIVVVIDGSTDGTREFLDEYCQEHRRVRYVDNVVNRGLPYSRNRGIEEALCEYVFMGEDDLELTEGFFTVLGDHARHSDADIVCGRNIFTNEHESAQEALDRTGRIRGPYVDLRNMETQPGMNLEVDTEQLMLASPMFGKTSIFRDVKYDDGYRVNFWREESDFQLKAQQKGYKLVCCPHAVGFNFMIENDRGGCYSTAGFRRARATIRNNWRFVNKHEQFIKDNFNIGNKYLYILRFSAKWTYLEVVWPPTLKWASRSKKFVTARISKVAPGPAMSQ